MLMSLWLTTNKVNRMGMKLFALVLVDFPNWIGALSAVALVVLTLLTLLVLKEYATDTKTIAKASASQTEDAQKPFLVLRTKYRPNGELWIVENQGFGPAINIRHSEVGGSGGFTENVNPLAKGDCVFLDTFDINVMRNHVFTVEYESLSGTKYRTVVAWEDGVMRTTFLTSPTSPVPR